MIYRYNKNHNECMKELKSYVIKRDKRKELIKCNIQKKPLQFTFFSLLPYDIQNKIYEDTILLQSKDKYKNVMNELQNNINKLEVEDHYFNKYLYNVYTTLNCGTIQYFSEEHNCICVDCIYDKLYYDNLDYLMDCFLETTIDFDLKLVDIKYTLKDNTYHKYEFINWEDYEMSEEYDEEDYSFKKFKCWDMNYDLYDWECYDYMRHSINNYNWKEV